MATGLEILCGVVAVLIALYYYFTGTFNFWKERGVPGPEPTPAFGNIFSIMMGKQAIIHFLSDLYHKYRNEPFVGIFARRTPILIVQDPDYIKDVLIKDFSKFADRGFITAEKKEPVTQHLFALESKRWKPIRTHLSPVFTSGKLKGTFSLILECAEHLEIYLDKLVAKGEPIECRELAARYTTDVIGSCAFGIEMNSLSEAESEFRRHGKEIFATHLKAILKHRLRETMTGLYNALGYILPYDEVNKFFINVTNETMNYRKHNNIVRPDFLNVLLDLQEHPEKMGDIELTNTLLVAQAFVFFAAGFETSSTTISNCLYELALNHSIQDELREEIQRYHEKYNGNWTYECIKEMKYLDKVFRETLRKYPPLGFLMRKSTDNYTFQNSKLSIPKETNVWIPLFSIHRDPNIYPNPDKFDPERFQEDVAKTRHPMHYLPFGDGPRNCIGARFAVFQVKIGLIKILRNYKVDTCKKTPIPYVYNPYSFVLCSKDGIYLEITKLEK